VGFLKKLFGSSPQSPSGDKDGLFFYIRFDTTGEVVKLRLNRSNDLSLTDDESGYFVRKIVMGQNSFDRLEVFITFDKNRRFLAADTPGGELVDEAAYLAAQNNEA
jgi:hypothetical protein